MLPNFYVRIGQLVVQRHDTKRAGKITRVYPFTDRANILVKWHNGGHQSYFAQDLALPKGQTS